jgi:Ni/Fe-hydrogenase subunit HybB-like protein
LPEKIKKKQIINLEKMMYNTMINKTRALKDILWIFVLFGLVAGIFRFWFGLGATTNLSDAVPWGLWKVFNMIAGVALSTCGFTLGFLVYILKMEQFKPLLKPAILVAFLGYGSSCFALLFDIGLPDRFWHPFFMWNEHSFLFEVFWCVILYFTITFIELMPNILERFRAEKLINMLHKIAVGIVIIGISLSTLHHSSLGSLFLVTPQRLHILWYSPLLPVLFFLSAAGCGIFFLILIKILYARWYDPESVFGKNAFSKTQNICALNKNNGFLSPRQYGKDMPMLSTLSIIAASILGLYLLLKIYDLIANHALEQFLAGTWESWLFGFEIVITTVLPLLLIAINRTRHSPYGLASAAFLASSGLILNRMNVGVFGYFRDAGTIYFPSLAEWALGIGVIAGAALLFMFIVENVSIFDERWKERDISRLIFKATFDSISHVWQTVLCSRTHRITLMAVFVLSLAFILMYPPYSNEDDTIIMPAKGLDITRSVLTIDGNHTGVQTDFPHLEHQNRLGRENSCRKCHHLSLPNDQSTPCSRCHCYLIKETMIFDHTNHTIWVAKDKQLTGLYPQNYTCTICHLSGTAKTSKNTKECIECHNKDMNIANASSNLPASFLYAVGFMGAMHKTCITCHTDQKKVLNKPNLDGCSNCHKTLSATIKPKKMVSKSQNGQEEIVSKYNYKNNNPN